MAGEWGKALPVCFSLFSTNTTLNIADTRYVRVFPTPGDCLWHQRGVLKFNADTNWSWCRPHSEGYSLMLGAIMGGPARDEVMKKIPGRQGRPGPHPWWGHKENTWQARLSRIRDPPGWPRPLPYPISSPLFCCCSHFPCCGFLCCLPRALLLLFHWIKTNL